MTKLFHRFIRCALAFSLAGLPFTAQAGLIGTDEMAAPAPMQTERARILDFMSRADVQQELQAQGLTTQAAQSRVDALTNDEVRHLAGKIDELPAGATSGAVGVVGVAVLLVLVTYVIVRLFYPQK